MAVVPPGVDAGRIITDLLLRGPREPEGTRSHLFTEYFELATELGIPLGDAPFTGVAEHQLEMGSEFHVFVRDKALVDAAQLERSLRRRDLLPVPLKVIESGAMLAAVRPTMGGDSIGQGQPGRTTGTIGCMVVENNSTRNHLLTSCHAVSNSHSPIIGAPIWQPGPLDGGGPADVVGRLAGFVPITLGGNASNEVDAALVALDDPGAALPGIRALGAVYRPDANPALRSRVLKNGRTTQVTEGTLTYKGMTFLVTFPAGDALFFNQYGIVGTEQKAFAAAGDSGAVVMNHKQEPIGLVMSVAAKMNLVLCNPIASVLSALKVRPA